MSHLKLPDAFVKRMQSLLGETYRDFEDALSETELPTIRLHPDKEQKKPQDATAIPWEPLAFTLKERPIFALDPAWHAGAYYVQESSSMLTGAYLREIITRLPSPVILDACAAPGGKSTHLLSIMNGNGILVANETIQKRNIILTENIQKWGYPNVVITKETTQKLGYLNGYFDIIVVDAPCSGEGLFRKDPDAVREWSEEAVYICANRQKEILRDLVPALKKGGYLCYSTCTFEVCENEEQVQHLLDSGLFESVHLESRLYDGLQEGFLPGTIRCWPHKVNGSGFFLALLRKIKEGPTIHGKEKVKSLRWKPLKQLPLPAKKIIKVDEKLSVWSDENSLRLFPKALHHDLQWLLSQLNVLYFGIEAGSLQKEIFTPAHPLCYTDIIQDEIPRFTLDLPAALDYLRKKNISLSTTYKGWATVEFEGYLLGWVKVLSDRINNYLPAGKMLRMQ